MAKKIDNLTPQPLSRYGIVKIKTLSFSVNEGAFVNDPNKEIKLELNNLLGSNIRENLLDVRLVAYFYYPENPQIRLAEITIQNIFFIENLSLYLKDNILSVPSQILIAILSISISHTRALLSHNLAGTVWNDIMLPITNPVEVAKKFFPSIVNKETGELNNLTPLQNMGIKM